MTIEQATPVPVPPATVPPLPPKPKLPDVHAVIDQVIRDLFGKDVQDT